MYVAKLESEISAYQHAPEAPWLQLLSPHVSRSQYTEQLARAYGFEVPLEAAFAQSPQFTLTFGARARSRLLSRDLFALDYQGLRSLPRRPMLFNTLAQACGWLYVLERTAQLYPRIASHVLARIPHMSNACTYLSDLGAEHRWTVLVGILESVACSTRIQDQITESAVDACGALAEWYAPPEKEALRAGA